MARLQILELPEGADDSRPPFVLVIDQAPRDGALFRRFRDDIALNDSVADRVGARAVLVFEDTIEIPANEVSIGPDGYPVRLRVEADLDGFREQVDEALADVQRRAEIAEDVTAETKRLMERRTKTLRERAERAEAERVAADNMLRAVCEVFGGPHQDPVVKARETLARAEAAEAKLDALGKQYRERMDQVTDALGFDRLRDWDEIVSAIKRQRQIDVDGGHRFVAVPERDGGLRCSVCGVTRDLWADLPGTPTCAAIRERGYF